MENTVITINYFTGKMTLVLDNFIPAQSGQFRVVVDAVSKSDDPDRNAATIYNFIVGHVDDLKNLRSHCEPSNDSGKKQIAYLTAKIKKYISNIEVLRKYFPDLPEISDGEKIILKAATVYAIMRNPETRSNEIQGFHGWTFEKYGRKFEVRKDCKTYKIMPAGTGLACAEVSSRQKISAAVTEKLIGILKKADLVETAQKHFEELYENTESIYFPDENMTVQKATPAAVKADPEPVKADRFIFVYRKDDQLFTLIVADRTKSKILRQRNNLPWFFSAHLVPSFSVHFANIPIYFFILSFYYCLCQ